jgi:transposase
MTMTTIGLDLAKYVFQVHRADVEGNVIEKGRLRRGDRILRFDPTLPDQHGGLRDNALLGRELARLGHEVHLMPPQYVKAYLKRGKNDAADAAAICEAVGQPSMRFVSIKTEAQQAVLVMHRARDLLVRQRTQLINAFRGHAAEFGIIGAQGRWNVARLLAAIREGRAMPEPARTIVEMLASQFDAISARIDEIDAEIIVWHKANPVSQRLAAIPGIGPLIATAIAATVADPAAFRSAREFAAWVGLTPRQKSTGGKQHLGGPVRSP